MPVGQAGQRFIAFNVDFLNDDLIFIGRDNTWSVRLFALLLLFFTSPHPPVLFYKCAPGRGFYLGLLLLAGSSPVGFLYIYASGWLENVICIMARFAHATWAMIGVISSGETGWRMGLS
jgi:hypothetical protein